MEMNLYFSGLVLLVCAVHLATVAGQAVEDLARALSGRAATTDFHIWMALA